MQERVLNFRPTWTLSTDEPISANYYPINSAIVVRDTKQNLSMVVTNDRSQGGSVLDNAHIEFMQNRRLFFDDSRGVGEPLSEDGRLGLGIQVQATYTLHFVNLTATYSKQRFQQLIIDDPLQYHFAFNYTLPESAEAVKAEIYILSGQPAPVKFQLFPMERNVLLVRLENVGDLFDYPNGTHLANTTIYIDIPTLAKNLYYQAKKLHIQASLLNIDPLKIFAEEIFSLPLQICNCIVMLIDTHAIKHSILSGQDLFYFLLGRAQVQSLQSVQPVGCIKHRIYDCRK